MSRMVSLLRAVNVGGRNRVPMTALATLHEELGCREVRTLLNSGNVVFDTDATADALRPRLERALEDRFGFPVDVMLRSAAELRRVLDKVPTEFPSDDESRLVIHFLTARPAKFDFDGPERVRVVGNHVYVYYPDGQGRSRLSIEKLAKVRATARNLRTVRALLALVEG